MNSLARSGWSFWVDRGGTFTDLVAQAPDGRIVTHKLLSESPERYQDAIVEGIRRILDQEDPVRSSPISTINLGTTVGTNALLEGKGAPVVLIVNEGFKDALAIGNQSRPDLFALHIKKRLPLYTAVIEAKGRLDAKGHVIEPLNLDVLKLELVAALEKGCSRTLAINLMHAWLNPQHELSIAELALSLGFERVSQSHECSPGIRFVPRGDTTVLDAYLSPVFDQYKKSFIRELSQLGSSYPQALPTNISIMQSHGGLCSLQTFKARDSILSGPAGGLIGAKEISHRSGFSKIVTFDMGGTSTDVAHYAGELERSEETEVQGRMVRVPSLSIHTVAAGGGSVLGFDNGRLWVGPDSAGAYPGPACYRNGGPLTVTDANLLLGKIRPEYFPHVFGPEGREAIDPQIVRALFQSLGDQICEGAGQIKTLESLAEGFIEVAVEAMALAIRKISTQRGYDVRNYALFVYGAAGGQHACLVAERLGITTILLSPFAGVLSALGMGLAQHRLMEATPCIKCLDNLDVEAIAGTIETLKQGLKERFRVSASSPEALNFITSLFIRYEGSENLFEIPYGPLNEVRLEFERRHLRQFGFKDSGRALWVEKISVEGVVDSGALPPQNPASKSSSVSSEKVPMYLKGALRDVPVYHWKDLSVGEMICGPAMILEPHSTTIIEPDWLGSMNAHGELVLEHQKKRHVQSTMKLEVGPDPVLLELFNARFMAVAEEMGFTLQKTAASVNIRERLDFSCAIFDAKGDLVANAPHIPVHLGSMGACVQSLIHRLGNMMHPGDVWLSNSPYAGGTHLPDVTVITPVYRRPGESSPIFFVASRGHHADIGGISPGSMPPNSQFIDEEGVSTEGLRIVEDGLFMEDTVKKWLGSTQYPARNSNQNLADIKAQIAANQKGQEELLGLIDAYGSGSVLAYMGFIQDQGEAAIRSVIRTLSEGSFSVKMDSGATIAVSIMKGQDLSELCIDFTGTSGVQSDNQNAPLAIVKAAVLYVFRTLVDRPIPLNEGCLRPIQMIVPADSFLNPKSPSAVVAGNVETSQHIVDALYGALGKLCASQGTMNNLTFGNERHQYYETICGGTGAGNGFEGADAMQSHMTNSRLTDPEVLEWKYPVRVERFEIRPDSGGEGRYRGGRGVLRTLRFLEPMTVGMLSNRRLVAPHGLEGGGPGKTGVNRLQLASGESIQLPGAFLMDVKAGDAIEIETPGGGGYGKPSLS